MAANNVPQYVYEISEAKNERTVKRLIAVIIVLIIALAFCNGAWLYAWLQYDYVSETTETIYQQDGEGTNVIGEGNEVSLYGSACINENDKEVAD